MLQFRKSRSFSISLNAFWHKADIREIGHGVTKFGLVQYQGRSWGILDAINSILRIWLPGNKSGPMCVWSRQSGQ